MSARTTGIAGHRQHYFDRPAAKHADENYVIDWMLDRKSIPLSVAADEEFSKEYFEMTKFIWPVKWEKKVRF